ncbi:hypothetical protein ACTQ1D_01885 [Parafannyhessea umbonata]|uniref:hypothetical protein n=1 Tax=Parafannyhessea umbonata TaxID=604330 RepID=UPI003F99F475
MAPTSDERREVARKLREDLPVARNVQEGYVAIMQTIGVRPCLLMVDGQSGDRFDVTAYEEGAARLADLIDPTCSMDAIDTGEQADHECREHIMHCSNCNAEFGYVLYGEDGDVSMDDKPKFCPECGKRVVDGDAYGAR